MLSVQETQGPLMLLIKVYYLYSHFSIKRKGKLEGKQRSIDNILYLLIDY